jgi:hypothetical protein
MEECYSTLDMQVISLVGVIIGWGITMLGFLIRMYKDR